MVVSCKGGCIFAIGRILLAFVLVPLIATLRILFSYILAKTRGLDPFPARAPAGHRLRRGT